MLGLTVDLYNLGIIWVDLSFSCTFMCRLEIINWEPSVLDNISYFMIKGNCHRTAYLQQFFLNAGPWSRACVFQKYGLM